ncbi:hypothetical protein L484_007187 [Morus notabilis]|uniref:Uncharacterized protein n=1 Tax=Morus notabilis TaxID=981085 RepID=W9QSQ4_9ROSA|nr:hypothetical protein L484_007187 [Morus notabilis]
MRPEKGGDPPGAEDDVEDDVIYGPTRNVRIGARGVHLVTRYSPTQPCEDSGVKQNPNHFTSLVLNSVLPPSQFSVLSSSSHFSVSDSPFIFFFSQSNSSPNSNAHGEFFRCCFSCYTFLAEIFSLQFAPARMGHRPKHVQAQIDQSAKSSLLEITRRVTGKFPHPDIYGSAQISGPTRAYPAESHS